MPSPSDHHATPADDEFHVFDPAEWWAIETVWFAFTIPDRALNAVVYLINRPAMDLCALQINIFDASGHEPWENRHWRSLWHLPRPKSLQAFEMPQVGYRFQVLEPLKRYRLAYEAGNARFDVTWEALVPPRMSGPTHIDQYGRVTGTLWLDDEQLEVDCLQMRDRSWTRRSDLEGVQGGYTYALASGTSAFLMASARDNDDCTAQGGWLNRDGRMVDLAYGGRKIVARGPSGQPLRVEIWGEDKAGRRFQAAGESVSRSVMHTSGNIHAWDSLMRWTFDGVTCWGEDQDVWTPESWRAASRG